MASNNNHNEEERPPATFLISGGGIVGAVLALCLKKQLGIVPEVYEKANEFHDDLGAGMGMYPNGLRVLRDISPELLETVRNSGHPFLFRRWAKHDGAEIVEAVESVLHEGDSEEVQSLGIARWRLQKILLEAVKEAGIPIHFGKGTISVNIQEGEQAKDNLVQVKFEDGTCRWTKVCFATDGTRSTMRRLVTQQSPQQTNNINSDLSYTGVTCLMGMGGCAKTETGVCSPVSTTTKCHATFFPTEQDEQCFQFYFPANSEIKEQDNNDFDGNWGTLSEKVAQEECHKLAEKLRAEGWDEKYLLPLEHVKRAVRVGFYDLQPPLNRWVYGGGRIVLLGDAAHPPIPYTGQGAQMGIEDAGSIAMLLKAHCLNDETGELELTTNNFDTAMNMLEKLRIPRVEQIHDLSVKLGAMQQRQAECRRYARKQAMMIQREVFFHNTLPIMVPGAQYDYAEEVNKILQS